MGILGGGNQAPKEFGVDINESSYGSPYVWAMGTVPVQQQVLWVGGFTSKKLSAKGSGGKGGGKDGQYDYSADVVVALCNGPILGIGDVWSGQSWLGSPIATETYTITSPYTYTPVNAGAFYNDLGVGVSNTYSATYNDLGAPTSTVLSGTDLASMVFVPWWVSTGMYVAGEQVFNGTDVYTAKLASYNEALSNTTYWTNTGAGLTTGEYSINPATGTYYFSSSDNTRSTTVSYSYLLTTINRQETDIVPSGKTITVTGVGSGSNVTTDYGVIYTLTGVAFTKVSGTPSVTGTYSISGLGGTAATYKFATGDINAEVTTTFGINNPDAVSPGQAKSLNYTLNAGYMGQPVYSFLTSNHPEAAFGYTGIATLLFQPMDLGPGAEIQENRYEVITPQIVGSGIQDCNPITCITEVLTNQQCGLGVGKVPFPTACMDNGSSGTWGSAPSTPGARTANSTVWNWCAAQGYYISPKLDSQDSVSDSMGKWLEAGMIMGFYSEGLLKLAALGDTSTAGNGYTWEAAQSYVVALDDTCFVAKEGTDPVKITRSSPADAWNTVQVQFDNRLNQYASQTVMESDQAFIDRWGPRIEDPQEYNFIRTVAAATFSANLRLKRGLYIRNTYEFTLPYSYSYLEPMDIVTISTQSVWSGGLNNVNLGIVNLPVRIIKVIDDPIEGLQITAEDYPFGAHQPTLYNKQLTTSQPVANVYADPGNTEVVWGELPSLLAIAYGNPTGDTLVFAGLGTSQTWGGGNINIATTSGGDYICVGEIEQPGKIGQLAAAFPYQQTDSFSSGTTLSASWTVVAGTFTVTGGVAEVASVPADFRANACFTGTTFNANQYAQVTITSVPASADALGVAVRMSNSAETFYGFYCTNNIWYLFKLVAGTETTILQGTHTPAINDVLYLNVIGTTLTASINGTVVATTTDSSISSGYPGITGFKTFNSSNSIDNFVCGNTSGDPDTTNTLLVSLVENCAMWDGGTSTDADQHNTLIMVDSEVMAFSAVTYTGQSEISMGTYIRRGLYGTAITQHQTGALVIRLDSSVFTYNYPPQWRGQTVYGKFQSVNLFQNMAQDLSTLTPTAIAIPGLNSGSIDAGSGLLFPQYNTAIYQGAYNSGTAYKEGNIVGYNGNTYQCIENTTAGTAPSNTTYWILISANNAVFLGNWSSSPTYQISNTVIDVAGGGGLYYCLVSNSNVQPSTNSTDWQPLGNPSSNVFIGTYSGTVHYVVGNIVEYQGSQWVCISNAFGSAPAVGSSSWTLLGSNALFMGTWVSGTTYTQNMTVAYQSNLYQAVQASTGQTPSPTSTTYWQITGPATLDNLTDGSVYIKGVGLVSSNDIVVNNSNFQASATTPIPNWGASNATLSYETSSPYAGTQSLKVVSTAQFGGAQSVQTWAVSPGQQFVFSCAMKSDGTQIADAGVAFYQGNGTFISSLACPAYTTNAWTVAQVFGAAPALASTMKIFLENGTGAGGVVEFDNVNLQMMLTSSATLIGQGSIATVSDYTFSYTSTTTTITWSWTAFNVYCPNGSIYTIAASTGSATTFSLPTTGTVQSATTPIEYTGLTASHTYYFTPYVTLNANGTGTVNILWTSTTAPTLVQMVQTANADGAVTCSGSVYVTAATPSSGSGGGGGGGGGISCFSPNTKVKTQRGDIPIAEIRPEMDYILTARGTWKKVVAVSTRDWVSMMMDMGDGELTTMRHHFLDVNDPASPWKRAMDLHPEFPLVPYKGTIHNLHIDGDDDAKSADTEHSYTLANGHVVHNILPT
jgi:hypothetical protein